MRTYKWYRYTFEDGTVSITRGMDKAELNAAIRKHGKLVSKVYDGTY